LRTEFFEDLKETLKMLMSLWLWITILSCLAVYLGALGITLLIVILPSPYNWMLIIFVIIGWGVAGGIKDWYISKQRENKKDSMEKELHGIK